MNVYWGDLHNHCGISYGFGSLENALSDARTHLDFCAVTGHAMWPDMYEANEDTAFIVDFHQKGFAKLREGWDKVRQTVAEANGEGFVTFQSYEMHSCLYGDHHFLSPDDRLPLIYRDTPGQIVRDCGVEAIAVPHHIGYVPSYRGINWSAFDEKISPVVEVYSKHGCSMRDDGPYPYYHDMGPRTTCNTVAAGLAMGKRFSFVGSTDHHAGYPGSYGDGLTAILAESLTREALWEAIRAGRVYAVTGDRILCDFHVNDLQMGEEGSASRRSARVDVTFDDAFEKIVLYKNGAPVRVETGEFPLEGRCTRYKLRVEMGWGDRDEIYPWDGEMRVDGGRLVGVHPCFRGRSVLSPNESREKDADSRINLIRNEYSLRGENECAWHCETVRNKSTLHPCTDALVFEIEGSDSTLVRTKLNGREHTAKVGDLLREGFAEHMKPWHSQAYRIHRCVPETMYRRTLAYEDERSSERDEYHVECMQRNGQWAFISPIFVR